MRFSKFLVNLSFLLLSIPSMVTTMLAPRDLQDLQEQTLQETTSNHFGVQGPSLPRLREGSLYVSVYK